MYAAPLAAAAALAVPVALGTTVSLVNVVTASEATGQFGSAYDFGPDPEAPVLAPRSYSAVLFGTNEVMAQLETLAQRPDLDAGVRQTLVAAAASERRAALWGAELTGPGGMADVQQATTARLSALHSALLASEAFRATRGDTDAIFQMVSRIPGMTKVEMIASDVMSFQYRGIAFAIHAYSQGRYHLFMQQGDNAFVLIREGRANETSAQSDLARLLQALTRGHVPVRATSSPGIAMDQTASASFPAVAPVAPSLGQVAVRN